MFKKYFFDNEVYYFVVLKLNYNFFVFNDKLKKCLLG